MTDDRSYARTKKRIIWIETVLTNIIISKATIYETS